MIGFDDDFRIPFGKGGEGKYWNINIVNLILCNDKRRLFCKVYLFILLCVALSSYVTAYKMANFENYSRIILPACWIVIKMKRK